MNLSLYHSERHGISPCYHCDDHDLLHASGVGTKYAEHQ